MAARGQLQKLQNLNFIYPTIWRCAGDLTKKNLLKIKMSTIDKLLWVQKLKNYGQ